jgi:hypothetical protein
MKRLSISATNKCPLQCNHCGPESGPHPQMSDTLDLDSIKKAIIGFQKTGYTVVNFSGGEPILLGDVLIEAIKFAKENGIKITLTTGGYWAKDEKMAKQKIDKLTDAGLDQICISLSDSHLEFVTLQHTLNIVRAARPRLNPIVSIASYIGSNITLKKIAEFFLGNNEHPPLIDVASIIPFGRATANYPENTWITKNIAEFAGPCKSVFNNAQVHPNGNVTACSSVLSSTCEPLIAGNIHESSVESIAAEMQTNPLLNWIHSLGPVHLKFLVEENTDIRFNNEYVNICHLCGDILSNKKALEFLKQEGMMGTKKTTI